MILTICELFLKDYYSSRYIPILNLKHYKYNCIEVIATIINYTSITQEAHHFLTHKYHNNFCAQSPTN